MKYNHFLLENKNNLKKLPIPLYHKKSKILKKYIHKKEETFLNYLEQAYTTLGYSAIVCSTNWYIRKSDWLKNCIDLCLPDWTKCEYYRENKFVNQVVVLALKPNKKSSSTINKRIVDRAYEHENIPTCVFTGKKLIRKNASAEHIIPLSCGGNNSIWNLCVSHKELNNDRGNEDFWDYWLKCL